MSGINDIPIYHNGHSPGPIIPRQFDETCPHCQQLGYGKIDEYELLYRGISPSSENGLTTHVNVYGRGSDGVLRYISIPLLSLKQYFS